MVGLVVRKSAKGLLKYFGGDFESRIWVDETGQALLHPLIGNLRRGDRSIEWMKLESEQFQAVVHAVDSERGKGEVLALELGFAPPKSVSIAGLGDEKVSLEIIQAHLCAVDDVLTFLSPQLVARAKGELIDCGLQLLQFAHPWNRGKEPQLHSHIILLKDLSFSHALWTTLVFLLQRSLREVYHYSLASRLLVQGFSLRLGPEGSLAWELKGVPEGIVSRFGERSRALREIAQESPKGYFSMGAEFRLAAWASRRQLPPTDHSVALADARKGWRKKMPDFELFGASPRVETTEVRLQEVFRRSSVLTREQIVACHLSRWIGARAPLSDAISMASRHLADHVRSKRLLRSREVYCLPEALEVEGKVLFEISKGFDGDGPLFLRKQKPRYSQMRKLLATRHAVKVISTDGEPPPVPTDLLDSKGRPFRGTVETLRYWDSREILGLIERRKSLPIVIFVEEPVSVGDFGYRSTRLLLTGRETVAKVGEPFVFLGRQVLVQSGDLAGPKNKASFFNKVVDRILGKPSSAGDPISVTLLPGDKPERLQELNWKKLESETDGRQVVIYRRVPWDRVFAGAWTNLGIFAFRKVVLPLDKVAGVLRTIRGGTAWFFEKAENDQVVKVRGKRQSKRLILRELKKVIEVGNTDLALIEPVKVNLQPGTPLAAFTRLEADGQVFRPGEVHIVDSVSQEGMVRFASGSHWPNPYLVMEPAFFVAGFTKSQPRLPSIRIAAPTRGDRTAWLENLPAAGLTVVYCSDPKGFCQNLERDSLHCARAKRLAASQRLTDENHIGELSPLFPKIKQWRELAKQAPPEPDVPLDPDPVRGPSATGKEQRDDGAGHPHQEENPWAVVQADVDGQPLELPSPKTSGVETDPEVTANLIKEAESPENQPLQEKRKRVQERKQTTNPPIGDSIQ